MLARVGRIYFETLEEVIENLEDIIEETCDSDMLTDFDMDRIKAVRMLKRDICNMKDMAVFTTRK